MDLIGGFAILEAILLSLRTGPLAGSVGAVLASSLLGRLAESLINAELRKHEIPIGPLGANAAVSRN